MSQSCATLAPWFLLKHGVTHLHRDQTVINQDFFGQEVGAYRRFVACAEFLVDLQPQHQPLSSIQFSRVILSRLSLGDSYVLIHQARLANPAVTEDNDLCPVSMLQPLQPELTCLKKDLFS